jgi:hypothetical protein
LKVQNKSRLGLRPLEQKTIEEQKVEFTSVRQPCGKPHVGSSTSTFFKLEALKAVLNMYNLQKIYQKNICLILKVSYVCVAIT